MSLFITSCKQTNYDLKQNTNTSSVPITNHSKKEIITDTIKEKKYRWVQYKRVPAMDLNDTIPVKNCYLIIEFNIVSRYIDETLIETQTLIRDDRYSFPSYYFKDNPDDILQYLDKEQSKLVIKRDNFDGIQDYYIKKEL